MRKVVPICIIKDNKILNLTVITTKGNTITLIDYSYEKAKPFCYNNFQSLYKDVLNILKSNDFYCSYHIEFEAKWYEINWIDLSKSETRVLRYAYTLE